MGAVIIISVIIVLLSLGIFSAANESYRLISSEFEIIIVQSKIIKKQRQISSSEIDKLLIETIQGYPIGLWISLKNEETVEVKIKWRKEQVRIESFAVRNQIYCEVNESYHGGGTRIIVDN